ncbi:MAG: hypothetical protein ACREXW_02910 [Gammaproteobacteria bacterium]
MVLMDHRRALGQLAEIADEPRREKTFHEPERVRRMRLDRLAERKEGVSVLATLIKAGTPGERSKDDSGSGAPT